MTAFVLSSMRRKKIAPTGEVLFQDGFTNAVNDQAWSTVVPDVLGDGYPIGTTGLDATMTHGGTAAGAPALETITSNVLDPATGKEWGPDYHALEYLARLTTGYPTAFVEATVRSLNADRLQGINLIYTGSSGTARLRVRDAAGGIAEELWVSGTLPFDTKQLFRIETEVVGNQWKVAIALNDTLVYGPALIVTPEEHLGASGINFSMRGSNAAATRARVYAQETPLVVDTFRRFIDG